LGFLEVQTLFIDDADIVNMQVLLKELGTELRQRRQDILLAGIEYRQYSVPTETALITIDEPIQQHNHIAQYKHKNKNKY